MSSISLNDVEDISRELPNDMSPSIHVYSNTHKKMVYKMPGKESSTKRTKEVSSPSQSLPYMNREPEEIFSKAIEKREDFATIVKQIFEDELRQVVANLSHGTNTDTSVSWVGGSRAWNASLKCFDWSPQQKPSRMTRAAIVPGNYDFFIIHTGDSESLEERYQKLEKYMKRVLTTLNGISVGDKKVVDYFELEIKQPRSIHKGQNLERCALGFPCYSIGITIKTRPGREAVFLDNTEFTITEDDKWLLYIELIWMRGINIPRFRHELFGPVQTWLSRDETERKAGEMFRKMLNTEKTFQEFLKKCPERDTFFVLKPLGLYMISLLIVSTRKEKGFNVDSYRDALIRQIMKEKGMSRREVFSEIIRIYQTIFSGTEDARVKSTHKDNLEHFMSLEIGEYYQEKTGKSLEDDISVFVVEKVRPLINSCILILQEVLQRRFGDRAFVIVIGGDAMRRYKSDISITKDIDTKVYHTLRTKKDLDDLKGILLMMTSIISLLCNTHILVKEPTLTEASEFGVYVPNIGSLKDLRRDIGEDYVMKKLERLSNEFKRSTGCDELSGTHIARMRYIESSTEFPVDLFSIDVRVGITYVHEKVKFSRPITIPVLDIVMQELPSGYTKSKLVNPVSIPESGLKLPVASLYFLIQDLRKTYSEEKLAMSRYWGQKSSKDEKRLFELEHLADESGMKSQEINQIYDMNLFLTVVQEVIEKVGKDYRTLFVKVMNERHRKDIYKHKLPFSKRTHCLLNYRLADEKAKAVDWTPFNEAIEVLKQNKQTITGFMKAV